MSEAKFTNGEWIVDGKYQTFLAVSDGQSVICDVTCCPDDYYIKPTGEQLANAYLIAAAPEMYKEIERDIERLNYAITHKLAIGSPEYSVALRDLEIKTKLLAKARGEHE